MNTLNGRGVGREQRTTMMRIATVLALTLGMVVLAPTLGARAAEGCHPFEDVDATGDHCPDIAWLAEQRITTPADGHFRPGAAVGRQAMAAFFFRLTHGGDHASGCSDAPFPDVDIDNAFCGAITWLAAQQISAGYADGTYRPTAPVTRRAMAAFLHRLATGESAPSCDEALFDDVTADDTFCGAIDWMAHTGISDGVGCGYYGPGWVVTRGGMAALLHRTARVIGDRGGYDAAPGDATDSGDNASDATGSDTGDSGTGAGDGDDAVTIPRPDGCTPPQPPRSATQPSTDTPEGSATESDPAASGSASGPARAAKCPPSASACIDLTNAETWLQHGGEVTYGPVPITSGRPGYRTRPGTWHVYWKDKHHISGIYNAAMPNSVFFDGGIAFHQGDLHVTSHGCIHLSRAASATFFHDLHLGDVVYVFGRAAY